jgi:hypothetical protein
MLNISKSIPILLAYLSIATPLESMSNDLEYMDTRMPYQRLTMLCGCHVVKSDFSLDGASCDMPYASLVLKPLIPMGWLNSWVSQKSIKNRTEDLNAAVNDPIINAYFTNISYEILESSAGIQEGAPVRNYLKGCSISKDDRNVLIVNGSKLGIVSRAALYLEMKYKAVIPKAQKALFVKYNEKFPPTKWEKRRNKQAYEYKGTWNPFVSELYSFHRDENKRRHSIENKIIETRINHLIEKGY